MKKILFALNFLFILIFAKSQVPAFPGAEGHGKYTTGGRGGYVYFVTNLNDAGPGSLRYGIESSLRPLTIIFRVSGIIELKSDLRIKNGNLTIAGQTAPGDGICIKNAKLTVVPACTSAVCTLSSYSVVIDADNVILRYLRFRPGDEIDNSVGAPISNIKFENDGIWGRNRKNIIIDHCSMSWAIDEVASFYDNENFTMQWCIITESLYKSFHPKGNHGYGGIWGGMKASFHHNLISSHTSRNPRFCGARYHLSTASSEIVDFRNNVVFNWGGNNAYGGEAGQHNIAFNYYKPGPATKKVGGTQLYRIVQPSLDASITIPSSWFLYGSTFVGYQDITENNAIVGRGFQPDNYDSTIGRWARVGNAFNTGEITTQTPERALQCIIEHAGASLYRDTVDKRAIAQLISGTSSVGGYFGTNTGIIDSPSQVGGWPQYKSTEPPIDSDSDGMPDDWEIANGLNPNNPDDRNNLNAEGYTMLEVYLNSLVNFQPLEAVNLNITINGNGFVLPHNGLYEKGSTIKLVAYPEKGWKFDGWSGDTVTSNNKIVLTLNSNKNLIANFSVVNGIKTFATNNKESFVYPNPVSENGILNIYTVNDEFVDIIIYDMHGKLIKAYKNIWLNSGYNEFELNVQDFISGNYIYKIVSNNNILSGRFNVVK